MAKKKKLLIICTNADEAGAPKHVESLVENLDAKYDVVVVFGESGPVASRLVGASFHVEIIEELRNSIDAKNDLVAISALKKLVDVERPDLIHCHSAKASMVGRLVGFMSGTPVVYTVHGWGWRGLGFIKGLLIWFVEFVLARIPDVRYVYVADVVRAEAKKYLLISDGRGKVIYNGVKDFGCCEINASNSKVVRFMMPARVAAAKDHETLVRAFDMLDEENSELILCGGGTEASDFQNHVKNLAPKAFERIKFLGQVSDMQKIYAESDVVVLASKFEALPLSIIEGMSCGRAVIATKVGGVGELIDDGINGLLVKKSDVSDLYRALKECMLTESRQRMALNARKKYSDLFAIDAMINSVANVYQCALGPSARR